ncbi:hypothetical protein Dsin_023854, partial [Dipteronia sinensis]
SYKEIYKKDETHVGIDYKPDIVLQQLESLIVKSCENLIKLVPSTASFQNLTFLKVMSCNGLKNLMTASTAKSLVKITEMMIKDCESLIEVVVAKEGDATEGEIIFSKLRTLTLPDLPSLSCFCSENYTFELPSLEQLTVNECPEMEYFSSGDVTKQILQKVERGWTYYALEGDLNTTIKLTPDGR